MDGRMEFALISVASAENSIPPGSHENFARPLPLSRATFLLLNETSIAGSESY
jgi:hypothetical protein